MSIRKLILAVAVVASPAAFANGGATWVGGEAGFELHALDSTKTRQQVQAELAAFRRDGGQTGSGELAYEARRAGVPIQDDGLRAMGNAAATFAHPTGRTIDPYMNGGPQ